ncbi:ferroxidase FET3 SCDLUD_004063 [Saccharomycodes ludwigii]|nr:hypothetical protein SCDLUD_004063 [Saccharomycodes ludwigii]KAH3899774.1 hypothetical protein SCDLUD_004063 [Saccharomycodes ludwigii]
MLLQSWVLFSIITFFSSSIISKVHAATHVYNWTTGLGDYNVDGTDTRPIITCNGEFPWPDIRVTKGDRIIKGEIVELVLNNNDTGTHPFHLHGHAFQTVFRDVAYDVDANIPHPYNGTEVGFREYPMIRDTFYVRPLSSFVIRFMADNPGVWFFHCHIEWHLMQGLALVLVEAPDEIQNTASQQLTDNHIQVCKNIGVPYVGNAAGNSENFLDLTGQNVQQQTIPTGFTKKGIIAMTFTCFSGFLGMVSLATYGLAGISTGEEIELMEDLGIDPEEELEREEQEDGVLHLDNRDSRSSNFAYGITGSEDDKEKESDSNRKNNIKSTVITTQLTGTSDANESSNVHSSHY